MFSHLSSVVYNFFYDLDDKDVRLRNERVGAKGYGSLAENDAILMCRRNGLNWFRRTGKITHICDRYGLIESTLYFEPDEVATGLSLKLGEIVTYLCYKAKDNETERVIKIEGKVESSEYGNEQETKNMSNEDRNSAETDGNEELPTESIERILNGKVTHRNGRELIIEPLNICCNLDTIEADFIPLVGDWVSLKAQVAVDVDVTNFAGEILDIKALKPLLIRDGLGSITFLRILKKPGSFEGVIENEIYFSTVCTKLDFIPSMGNKVAYTAVESDQGVRKWRATSIRPAGLKLHDKENQKLLPDRNGIVILGDTNFGTLNLDMVKELDLYVINTGPQDQTLIGGEFGWKGSKCQFRVKSPNLGERITIKPKQRVKFVFECKAKFLGLNDSLFKFQFHDFQIGRQFRVNVIVDEEMNVLLPCETKTVVTECKNKTYTWKHFDHSKALLGVHPFIQNKFRSKPSTSSYKIPERLFKIVLGEEGEFRNSRDLRQILEEYAPYLKEELSPRNYESRFHTLLFLEEIATRVHFKQYDRSGVILRRQDNFLSIDISHMTDLNAVPLKIGSTVIVKQPWSEVNVEEQIGYVHIVRNNDVLIKFHSSFHEHYDETACDVSFEPSRSVFLQCHESVEKALSNLGESWLFPSQINEKPPQILLESKEDRNLGNVRNDDKSSSDCDSDEFERAESLSDFCCDVDENGYAIPREKMRAAKEDILKPMYLNSSNSRMSSNPQHLIERKCNLIWFNKNLNSQQKSSVINVLEGKGRPLPYIIHGPPGTGKTLTIIEIVLQIYHLMSDSRIVIATPSNSSSDLICEYLIDSGKFTPGEMIRILSFIRAMEGHTPEKIIPYCTIVNNSMSILAPTDGLDNIRISSINDAVGTQRIVIGTCSALRVLSEMNFERGHFSHIIIDEACQVTEPEALIPLSFLNKKRGQVVLCGDPEQLGAVCLSNFSCSYGLRVSLLERIRNHLPYLRDNISFLNTGGYDPRFISRLNINYRSVPEILDLPSQMFYDSELISTVSQTNGTEAEMIRRFNFTAENRRSPPAFIFHGVRGLNLREEGSPSWYNPFEIWQSICYLKRLYSIDLTPEDIGIITPYRKQVQKLRLLLSELDVPAPKIGSVEEFQGQERYAVILTTVRSSFENALDQSLIGFVASPRRLNVAITRARAILIIIGNPFTLSTDPYWSNVIQYCLNNDSYVGCPIGDLFRTDDSS